MAILQKGNKNKMTEGPQKETAPEIPANSDLEKYLATHPGAKVQRLKFTYTVINAGPDGEIVMFDLNGKRHERPAQQRSPVTYNPGTYEPANVSKIPADSDLGKLLREYPDAKVLIYTSKGVRSYRVTWGKKFNRSTDRTPKHLGYFDMNGHLVNIYQFKSATFKSGKNNIQDKKQKIKKALDNIATSLQQRN